MKNVKYSEDQKIGVLKEAGMPLAELCRQALQQRCNLLQLEGEVRRYDGQRCKEVEAVGG